MSHKSSSSRSSSSTEVNTKTISKSNRNLYENGSSTTFDFGRQCFKGNLNSRRQIYENESCTTFDLQRECFKATGVIESDSIDFSELNSGDHQSKFKFEPTETSEVIGDFQSSLTSLNEKNIELASSDSTSTLRAESSLSSKYEGDSVSMETLGYYDDAWNGHYEVLYEWIDRLDFVKNQKNVHRDFSDGVLMAELLKKLWPKMVDLHNYSPANSFVNKLANWTTLNAKVLRRLKLGQPLKTLQDLARAEPGVLETLLAKIKRKHDSSKMKLTARDSVTSEEPGSSMVVNGQKVQLRSMLGRCQQLQEELAEGDEVIKILRNKVMHLENLLQIKDETIQNLHRELGLYKAGPNTASVIPPSPSCSEVRPLPSSCHLGTASSLIIDSCQEVK